MIMMGAATLLAVTEIVVGRGFIAMIVLVVGMGVYQAATKSKDDQHTTDTISKLVRRCGECGQIVGKDANSCRHCHAEISGSA